MEMKDAVVKAILAHDPNEDVVEEAVRKLANYFWMSGYVAEGLEEMSSNVYFAYDVLKMVG